MSCIHGCYLHSDETLLDRFYDEAENGAVLAQVRFTAWVIAVLIVLLSGSSYAMARVQKTTPGAAIPAAEARVDINRATLDGLLTVPGMTRSWAERIVRFRPYRTKRDLLDRGIVSSQVYDRIKNYVIAHRDKP